MSGKELNDYLTWLYTRRRDIVFRSRIPRSELLAAVDLYTSAINVALWARRGLKAPENATRGSVLNPVHSIRISQEKHPL